MQELDAADVRIENLSGDPATFLTANNTFLDGVFLGGSFISGSAEAPAATTRPNR